MSVTVLMSSNQRIIILRLLAEDSDYSANESVIQAALALWGHRISADKVRLELDWLKDMGLVTINRVSESVHVAKITRAGLDVALGRRKVDGVDRPSPGE